MTALAGYWAFGPGEEPLGACARMLDAQRIYGPQPAATFLDGRVALGKRLFPTLPEDSFDKGPVPGGGGRWSMVADIRLDQRDELAGTLGIAPERARSLSDSALAMAAVERWEEDAIGRLAGDFAIALCDRDRQRLLLARDITGQRPLHYHRGPGFFAFASMPSGLQALEGVQRGADEASLASFLALLPLEDNHSFFEGIERLRPGEMHAVTSSGTRIGTHWSLPAGRLKLKRDEDYVDAVREALDRAVASRLRGADDRVATHLSGGLDSGGVTATAARLIGAEGKVTAFTSVPVETGPDRPGRFADEGSHAAAVAALYPNVEHVLIRTAGRSPIASLDRNFAVYQTPVLNLCNFVWGEAIADEARQRGHKVLLTGQVGNITFSHAGSELLPDLLARGRWLRLLSEVGALRREGQGLTTVAGQTLRPFIPEPLWDLMNRARGKRTTPAETSALHPTPRAAAARRRQASRWHPWRTEGRRLAALQTAEFGNFRQGALAGWGLDVRDPTGDRRLIELCLSIPPERYFSAGVPRALARRVLADRLPAAVTGETRKGLQAADWYLGVVGTWDEMNRELVRIGRIPTAARLLDMPWLTRLLQASRERDWSSEEAYADYRLALLRSLSAGHFIGCVEGLD